jgi:hypothetical protein
MVSRLAWDNVVIISRDGAIDTIWDGKVKNLVYNPSSMEWEAQEASSGGGGGGSTIISAATSSVEVRSMALKTAVDEVSSTLTYVGEAATGTITSDPQWRIKRLTQSGTVLLIEWADGDGAFNNVWDSRASLSYS